MASKTIRRILVAGILTATMTQAVGEPKRSPIYANINDSASMGFAIGSRDMHFLNEVMATKPELIMLFMRR